METTTQDSNFSIFRKLIQSEMEKKSTKTHSREMNLNSEVKHRPEGN